MKQKITIVLFFSLISVAIFWACKYEELPEITVNHKIGLTLTPNSVNGNSINLTCNLTNTENVSISEHGICWNTSGNPTINDFKTESSELSGTSFNENIEGLEPATDYYVKAYIIIKGVTIYSEQTKTNTTNGLSVLTTLAISEITAISATSGGNISDDDGFEITARGICWSTTINPTILNNHTINGNGTGNFASSLTGLDVNTTYYVRSYATNEIGTVYGNEISFTTEDGLATLSTAEITNISVTTATSGGNITDDGGFIVTARGVCWNTISNPTISDIYTIDGTGIGSYTSNLTGLEVNTTYYLRAYATNENGTTYGNEISFSTIGIITDYDGNEYEVVQINNQLWMSENLKTTHYADGTEIPLVESSTAWDALIETDKAYSYYNYSSSNANTYGALYNWAAAMKGASSSSANPSGIQGVCPDGWHLPSDDEWTELVNYITNDGHSGTEGTALKSTSGWYSNGYGTDDYDFSALPAGIQTSTGMSGDLTRGAGFYSATGYDTSNAWVRIMDYLSSGVSRQNNSKNHGRSIRCIKD